MKRLSGKKSCLPKETRELARRRIGMARGHLEGILRMLEGEPQCVDVMRQIKAVSGALNRAAEIVLAGHLKSDVAGSVNRAEAERRVDELMDVLKYR